MEPERCECDAESDDGVEEPVTKERKENCPTCGRWIYPSVRSDYDVGKPSTCSHCDEEVSLDTLIGDDDDYAWVM